MTATHRMLNGGEEDLTAQCRDRRRRRNQRRGQNPGSSSGSASVPSESSSLVPKPDAPGEDVGGSSSSSVRPTLSGGSEAVPVYGSMSIAGRRRQMEDAISIRTSLCRPEISRGIPVHFFGVFDGHGGPQVAAFCREKMHVLLMEELELVPSDYEQRLGKEEGWQTMMEEGWQSVMKGCFKRMDEMALGTCGCGNIGQDCGRHPAELGLTGSTAVVAVLTTENIIVANCGDSRAVLSHAGMAVPLSFDQKADRIDEFARIESLGGRIVHMNGARVEGILAMSRAIGDQFLKPLVISEPEIAITTRDPEVDECLIIASDGLWDVVSNEMACAVARECLRDENYPPLSAASDDPNAEPRAAYEGPGTLYPSRSASAAALLTRLAMGRNSSDNISVIVVDLKSY